MRARLSSAWERAHRPVDAASLAVLRMLFGAIAVAIPVRMLALGWVDRFYVRPIYFFPYWGFEWIRPLPAPWIHAVFVAMAVCGALVMVGLFYRAAIIGFFVLFTYVELCDVTTYLNHYYLLSLLSFLMIFLPLGRVWSLDARRGAITSVPAWMVWLLRFQIGCVYVFAALAKVSSDWLLHAQPLQIWLGARMDTPVIGWAFDRIEVAYALGWAGFLFDLTIPLWLSWRRARPIAYGVLLGFHAMTRVFFDIGMFPVIMSCAATVFFDPGWPRAIARRLGARAVAVAEAPRPAPAFAGAPRWAALALAAWCLVQVAVPLRAHAYGGNVLWHEQGMRWSWRVMCRQKSGSVVYRVRARGWRREREVMPRRYLTRDQEQEFAGQPDMILALAHHVAGELRARGEQDVEVRVDAFASLNGRRRARLIDPDVDLARVEDSLASAHWILPAPEGPPADLTPPALARAH